MTPDLYSSKVRLRHDEEVRMFGSDRRLALAAAEPSEPELATIAGLAAMVAAVPSALMTVGPEGVRAYVPILA